MLINGAAYWYSLVRIVSLLREWGGGVRNAEFLEMSMNVDFSGDVKETAKKCWEQLLLTPMLCLWYG